MADRTCTAIRNDGESCRSKTHGGRAFCIWHDPERREAAREARSRGAATAGKVRSLEGRRRRLETAGALTRFMSELIQDLLAGKVDPDLGRAVIYAVSVQRQLVEKSELAQRLIEVERLLTQRRHA